VKPKRGAPKGHPGWGGRPKGETLAICMKCGSPLTAAELRSHFNDCKINLNVYCGECGKPIVNCDCATR